MSAADGVTEPVQYVDRREGEVPIAAANTTLVRPLLLTSSVMRTATADLSSASALLRADVIARSISGARPYGRS